MAQSVASAPTPSLRQEPAADRPPERRSSLRHTYGAVDLGTNNCRLLIARPIDGGFTVVWEQLVSISRDDTDIYGTRVSAAGVVQQPGLPVSTGPQNEADFTLDLAAAPDLRAAWERIERLGIASGRLGSERIR